MPSIRKVLLYLMHTGNFQSKFDTASTLLQYIHHFRDDILPFFSLRDGDLLLSLLLSLLPPLDLLRGDVDLCRSLDPVGDLALLLPPLL